LRVLWPRPGVRRKNRSSGSFGELRLQKCTGRCGPTSPSVV
jgi:hypothetical protein